MLKTQIVYSMPGNITISNGEQKEITISTLTGEVTDWTIFVQRIAASRKNIEISIEQVTKDNSVFIGTELGAEDGPLSPIKMILPVVGGVYRALGAVIKVGIKGAGNFPPNSTETVKIQAFPSRVEGFALTKANAVPLPTFATAVFCLEANQGLYIQDIQDNLVAIITEFNRWIPLPANSYRVTTESGDDPVLVRVID
jgi:hypothetical protein